MFRASRAVIIARLVAVAVAVTVATPAIASASQKIAVVDLQKVLLSTKAGRAAKAQFESMQKRKKKQLKRRDNELKKQEKSLVQQRMNLEKELAKAGRKGITPLLKAKAQEFQAKARRFQEEILAFQKTQRTALKQLAKKEAQLLKPIETKIKGHINTIAKKNGYTLVLNRVAVVYHVAAVDITAEVTKRMGK